mgnify:CR=1 FL=1
MPCLFQQSFWPWATEERLQFNGASAVSLASDINVKFRKVILEKFKNHEISLLLGTDLLARGIDIENLEVVINFDIPRDREATLTVQVVPAVWEMKVASLAGNPSRRSQKLKKFAKVSELVLKNQELHEK